MQIKQIIMQINIAVFLSINNIADKMVQINNIRNRKYSLKLCWRLHRLRIIYISSELVISSR